MTELEIFQILRPIILQVTGVPECILGDPNAPAPSGSYAAVRPKQTIGQRGQANIYRSTVTGQESVDWDVRAQVLADCSVNFYRSGALDYAERLHQCNKIPSVSQALFENDLGWMGTQPINNLDALQSDNWEPRAQITINLAYETTSAQVVNSIERIPYEVLYEDNTVVASGEFPDDSV